MFYAHFKRPARQFRLLWFQGQIQEQLAEQKAKESEVSSFIKEYKEMQEKISQDIHRLKEHWEKYGYQAPKDAQKVASE